MQEFYITIEIKDTNSDIYLQMMFYKIKFMKYMSKNKRSKIISKFAYEKVKDRFLLLDIANPLEYLDKYIDITIHELKEEDYKEIIIS